MGLSLRGDFTLRKREDGEIQRKKGKATRRDVLTVGGMRATVGKLASRVKDVLWDDDTDSEWQPCLALLRYAGYETVMVFPAEIPGQASSRPKSSAMTGKEN